jgi:hypothetical protein
MQAIRAYIRIIWSHDWLITHNVQANARRIEHLQNLLLFLYADKHMNAITHEKKAMEFSIKAFEIASWDR